MERKVGLTRGQFFVPRLRMKDLAELNEHLRSQSIDQAKSSKHPTMPEKTVWEAFEEERPDLMPVPRPFDGYAENPARVSTTALVTFDRNRYSVPVSAVRRTVQVRAYADRIVIVEDGSVLAEHVRQFGRDKTVFDPWHYLPLLERKPGALRNGAPFRDWVLPEALLRARAALERFPDWDRQFVGILCAIPVYGLFAVAAACESALAMKTMSKDVVLSLLSQGQEEEPEDPVSLPSQLHLKEDPVADCSRYDALLGEAKHAA